MSNIKMNFQKLSEKGLFHIFGSSLLNKVILFLNNAIIVRLISIEEFSAFSYANNIMSIVLLLNGLGVSAGILQYCSGTMVKSEKGAYEKYALKIGLISNIMLTITIIFIGIFIKLPVEKSSILLILLSLMPILSFCLEFITVKFRTNLQNKKFAYITSINTLFILIATLIGGFIGNINTIIITRYFSIIIPICIGAYWLKNDIYVMINSKNLKENKKKNFFRFCIISLTNNALSQILYLVDIFLIGMLILDKNTVGIYKTATLIPFTLNFIPISIATFIYPYFAAKKDNKEWLRKNTLILITSLGIVNLIISGILIVFAPLIIKIIFGEMYMDAIVPFRILSFGYLITGTLRIPVGNILTMMKKVKYLLFVTISTGVINIFLDYVMIKKLGTNGAALTVVSIYIISSALTLPYLIYLLRNDKKKVVIMNNRR